jgi:hypothetical protein
MRPVALALVLLATASARAEGPVPIAVHPFSGRCFDAAQLAERVRARVGESPVTVGAPPRGSHQEVRVAERAAGIRVEVTARDGRGQIVGSLRRIVPADDCATALEVAGLIVARAALPLNWRETPRETPPEPAPHPKHVPPPTVTQQASQPQNSPSQNSQPQNSQPQNPVPQNSPSQNPAPLPIVPSPLPPRAFPSGPGPDLRTVRGAPAREPGTLVLRVRGPNRRWGGELDAAVYGAFNLDGGSDQPGGELALGFRRGRFGAAARGTVERNWSASAQSPAGPLALDIRRLTVAVEAHVDVPVRVGALRFVVGPELPLWRVVATGLPHPHTSLVTSFSVAARVLYHLDIGRLYVQGGVAFSVAPTSEDLSITGVGLIAHTPRLTIGPILALGVNL